VWSGRTLSRLAFYEIQPILPSWEPPWLEKPMLCTRDADLLEVAVQRFCGERGIQVMTDLEFIGKFKI
jgi:hypothetical protein